MPGDLELPPSIGVPNQPAPGPREPSGISVTKALAQPFEAQRWASRVAMASLWMLLPVVGAIAVRGWASEGMARLLDNHPDPFPRPRWVDFLAHLRRGLPSATVLLACLALLASSVGAALLLINAGVWATLLSAGTLSLALLGAGFVIGLGLIFWVLLTSNAVLTRAEISGKLSEALRGGQVGPLAKASWPRTVWAYARFAPVALLLLLFGATIGCIGVLPAWVVVELAATHLRYQLYRAQLSRGGQEVPKLGPAQLPSERRLLARGKVEEQAK